MVSKEMTMPKAQKKFGSSDKAQKKFGSALHASALSSGLAFRTPEMVQYMQPSSLLNQTKPGHVTYFCCLNQRTVSLQLESFWKHHGNFCCDPSRSFFHVIAGKEWRFSNIPSPVISKIQNNYSFSQEPFILPVYSQMWAETTRLGKSLHLWTQKKNTLASL